MEVKKWSIEPAHESESIKHYHFGWEGVTIEFHRIAEHLWNPIHNKRFQHWTEKHLQGDKLRLWNLDGVEILLPPVNFDALYIFNHAYHHFFAGGVGFRQLCDWARYLHTFSNDIDRIELSRDLKVLGLLRSWQLFGYIAVEYLGLPKEEMPLYAEQNDKKTEKVIAHILTEGNFGKYSRTSQKPKSYFLGKYHSFRHRQKRIHALFSVFPKDLLTYNIHSIVIGIQQVVKDTFSRKK